MKNAILDAGRVTIKIRETYFHGMDFKAIRNILERIGINPHTPIEIENVAVLAITPCGVLVLANKQEKIKLIEAEVSSSECPAIVAVREFRKRTGINIQKNDIRFKGSYEQSVEDENGDKFFIKTHLYSVKFNQIPQIPTEKLHEVVMVDFAILSCQNDVIKKFWKKS